MIAAHEGYGLRYAALLDSAGALLTEAGSRNGPLIFAPDLATPARTPPPPVMSRAGDRVRAFIPRPPPRFNPEQGGGGGRGGGGGPQGRRRDFWWVVEFEPLAAPLVRGAFRSLVFAGVGALLLTAAALVFWRASLGHERTRRRLEEQKRLAVLGEMSAVLAHEIRNPLASLKGNAQLLAEKVPEGTRERGRADRVVREAERLEALTSDLLDFARSGPMQMAPTDPAQVLRHAAEDVGGGIDLAVAGAPSSWMMDGSRVRQALTNLIGNARQSAPAPRGPIASVTRDGGTLVFEVRDFGPGLPEGADDRIFEPFFTTRTNGTGLGLAVVRRIAEMHGGAVSAGNHPQGGAIFRMSFPAGRAG